MEYKEMKCKILCVGWIVFGLKYGQWQALLIIVMKMWVLLKWKMAQLPGKY